MASVLSLLNRLLPFATPGTPIVQDVLHLAALCALLYNGPTIQAWVLEKWAKITHDGAQDQPEIIAQLGPLLEDQRPDDEHEVETESQQRDALQEARHAPREDDNVPNGPADLQQGPVEGPNIPQARNVGAKKAKSIARRDQRRAYNEFMRSQGEAQRARDAEGAAEREAALTGGRERRRAAEAAVEAKKAKEREQKREQEKKERGEEFRRRDLAVRLVRETLANQSLCDLQKVAKSVGGGVDVAWVEKMVRVCGVLNTRGDVVTMLTSTGWVAKLSEQDMKQVYELALESEIGNDGRISFQKLGLSLQEVLSRKTSDPR